jgi:RNA polymerase sigma-70 factor (ECF subfamily)
MSIYLPSCLPGVFAYAVAAGEDRGPPRRMSDPAPSEPPEDRKEIDAGLLRRMARRDQSAFAELYDRFSRPLYATALRILNDARESEDIVQEVFLALWEKAAAFESERGSAFSWAVTLTRNRSIDRIRMRKRRAELLAASAPEDLGYHAEGSDTDSADNLWLKEKAGAVRAAVATLPAEQQRALELSFFGGLTQQEIAEQLREPLGTVKARIRRGLLKLRETLSRNL